MSKFKINIYTPLDKLNALQADKVTNFLFTHLEQYGDKKQDIRKAIAYAMKETDSPGGFVIAGEMDDKLVGAVVINETGMEGYIPENILVYIAVHDDYRGNGIGKKLMKAALQNSSGDMALHVEPDNPAKFLYEKLGFENKYLEMRYKQEA